MRENRTYGSEGGETGYSTGLSYPYRPTDFVQKLRRALCVLLTTRSVADPRPHAERGNENEMAIFSQCLRVGTTWNEHTGK